MEVWIYTLASVVLVSVMSLAGLAVLLLSRTRLKEISFFLISFAVGGLVGDAFIHLLPASFEKLGLHLTTSLYAVSGMLLFFILEKFIRWRHCHIPTSETHLHPIVAMNLIGDGVHNLIDGIVIGASYAASIPIGISTTLAVLLHEIPQEIGDFGVLLHGGLSIKKAILFNFLSALAAVLGAGISLFMEAHFQQVAAVLLPITAGGFLYIAGSDLIPELHHEVRLSTSLWQFVLILLGVGIMASLVLLE